VGKEIPTTNRKRGERRRRRHTLSLSLNRNAERERRRRRDLRLSLSLSLSLSLFKQEEGDIEEEDIAKRDTPLFSKIKMEKSREKKI